MLTPPPKLVYMGEGERDLQKREKSGGTGWDGGKKRPNQNLSGRCDRRKGEPRSSGITRACVCRSIFIARAPPRSPGAALKNEFARTAAPYVIPLCVYAAVVVAVGVRGGRSGDGDDEDDEEDHTTGLRRCRSGGDGGGTVG